MALGSKTNRGCQETVDGGSGWNQPGATAGTGNPRPTCYSQAGEAIPMSSSRDAAAMLLRPRAEMPGRDWTPDRNLPHAAASASLRTSEPLTVVAATASSEYDTLSADKLIDDDISGPLAHTSSHLPGSSTDNFAGKGVGQKCPWWQLDLGETKTVDKVKLSAEKLVPRMRRLLYVMPMQDDGAVPYSTEGSMGDTEGATQGGVRVLVGNSARNRADTSAESPSGSGWWRGTAVGLICPEPPTGEECETIRCENPANCLDRFESAGYYYDDIGTAEVDCNGKQGRYVTIELPGITNTQENVLRSLGLTEVRIDEGSAPEADPAAGEEDGRERDEETSAAEAGGRGRDEETSKSMSTLLVIGLVVVLLFAAVGVAFAMGIFEAGPPQPTDAAPEAY
mmetsp:Transcript_17159/g.42613  ORF Transcript_17159/g.42613 Transcript_17159/m.42613 type:complete len:395 (+) Transcript_17159:615-1799(+)